MQLPGTGVSPIVWAGSAEERSFIMVKVMYTSVWTLVNHVIQFCIRWLTSIDRADQTRWRE